ncbi:hypothetical protein AHMF7616_01900 [Adhaeribacter pallidiroseus]|uniref:Uncharacterized protein n=1 Tax=Adhaeribacter pallidiroseus TaxID=2072847 RepID=A0A369QM26_9BACT|nr:hypothetical protein AHMF7616_01900 [Adhaeribacter pallidiroseus]
MAELNKIQYGVVPSSPRLLILVKYMEINPCQIKCITLALFREQLEKRDYANAVSSINYSYSPNFHPDKFQAHIPAAEFEAHLTRSKLYFESH